MICKHCGRIHTSIKQVGATRVSDNFGWLHYQPDHSIATACFDTRLKAFIQSGSQQEFKELVLDMEVYALSNGVDFRRNAFCEMVYQQQWQRDFAKMLCD